MSSKHSQPEKYPTNDRAEQRMRDDAAKRPAEDQAGKHDAPPADNGKTK